MNDAGETPLANFLGSLAEHSSGPAADFVRRTLRAVGMDVAFVAEFLPDRRVFRHVDSESAGAPIQAGDSIALDEGYCKRIVEGTLPELIPDTAAVPAAMTLPVTRDIPIGAHISVPIRLRNGRLYGTFCCFSFAPDPSLNERDLRTVRAFAELAAEQIDAELAASGEHEEARARIERVIREEQLAIVYQPILALDDGRIAGLECLARFSASPPRTPDRWFAEAGQVGLGTELELLAARKALAALADLPADTYLAVNISASTVCSREFAALVDGLPAERIVLEITEHELIPDYAALLQRLEPYRARGMRLAVDDAGAGYASLKHVLALNPELIKLDNSLVRGIAEDSGRRALAAAFAAFAREIGSIVVAEGIETQPEADVVRELGLAEGQGYFFARPMALRDAVDLLGGRGTNGPVLVSPQRQRENRAAPA